MEYVMNFGWIILALVITFILVFQRITNNPHAVTSKYRAGIPVTDVENLISEILASLKKAGFKKTYYNSETGKFYARSGISMSSWGENIEVQIDEKTVQFLSVCTVPFQIFDWGKNERNFNRFLKEFKRNSNMIHFNT